MATELFCVMVTVLSGPWDALIQHIQRCTIYTALYGNEGHTTKLVIKQVLLGACRADICVNIFLPPLNWSCQLPTTAMLGIPEGCILVDLKYALQ
jgi:hypothetical protein